MGGTHLHHITLVFELWLLFCSPGTQTVWQEETLKATPNLTVSVTAV